MAPLPPAGPPRRSRHRAQRVLQAVGCRGAALTKVGGVARER